MIAERFTFKAKLGSPDKAVELLKAQRERRGDASIRIYRTRFGQGQRVMWEKEFQDLAELEEFWDDLQAQPEFQEFLSEFNELIDSVVSHDIWTLA